MKHSSQGPSKRRQPESFFKSRLVSMGIFFAFVVIAVVSYSFISKKPPQLRQQKACTMEAKICPDGTAVGRSGPDCEFAACPAPTTLPQINPQLEVGVFKGTMPCADCSGLATELTLTRDALGSGEGTFILKEEYLGKELKPFITTGNWTTLRGTPQNKNATVYQLLPDVPGQSQYYLKVNETTLRVLDRDRNTIDAPFDMTLKKAP